MNAIPDGVSETEAAASVGTAAIDDPVTETRGEPGRVYGAGAAEGHCAGGRAAGVPQPATPARRPPSRRTAPRPCGRRLFLRDRRSLRLDRQRLCEDRHGDDQRRGRRPRRRRPGRRQPGGRGRRAPLQARRSALPPRARPRRCRARHHARQHPRGRGGLSAEARRNRSRPEEHRVLPPRASASTRTWRPARSSPRPNSTRRTTT